MSTAAAHYWFYGIFISGDRPKIRGRRVTSQPSPAVGDALSPPTRRSVSVFNSVISRLFYEEFLCCFRLPRPDVILMSFLSALPLIRLMLAIVMFISYWLKRKTVGFGITTVKTLHQICFTRLKFAHLVSQPCSAAGLLRLQVCNILHIHLAKVKRFQSVLQEMAAARCR